MVFHFSRRVCADKGVCSRSVWRFGSCCGYRPDLSHARSGSTSTGKVNPEKKRDPHSRRGVSRYGWGRGRSSIGLLSCGAAVASMLVRVSMPVRVVDRVRQAPGVITYEFDVFRHTSGGGVVFDVPPVIKW